ncbi:deacylase [Phyllobacterium phragmitis]|uniref:Deacylase n=1 Tax=Phyllobacterium phragmitis TaxID=2670329 RepID=A0A2S9IYU0_9HYPH|nr:succinylglutamate desuccinylase/aspartoacylase family protein [Phyllobacterium phragmitis]PRD45660.1 deacylase [Phyllobacterium phragmitis]
MHTGLFHTLDFSGDGKVLDYLNIPHSVDRSPYFHVKVPICRIRNGSGPRILLMAGNHGDEYEGEICLARLIRLIEPGAIRGELTILPFANQPAVMAARRRSPLDNGNLNRAFPGSASGTPTERLADFLEHTLFPMHDIVFDLHSGGTSMAHLTTGLIEEHDDPERHARALKLLKALGLPHAFIARNGIDAPTSMAAAARAGAIGISGEFGGGGTVTPETMATTALAINNLLIAAGIAEHPFLPTSATSRKTRLLKLDTHDQAIYATRRGWFEPAADIGAMVEAGDVAGWYHDFQRLDMAEETLRFATGGMVISRRIHTDCEAGDCLIQLGRVIDQ